jgi:hypothetical protein
MSDCSNFCAQFGKLFTKVLTRGMAALQSEELLGRDLINDCTMLAADLVRQPKLEFCSSRSRFPVRPVEDGGQRSPQGSSAVATMDSQMSAPF